MAQTVQEMIEQARIKERLESRGEEVVRKATKIAKADIRKERLEKLRGIFQMPTRVRAPIRKRDIRITAAARKGISLVAPKGSLIKAITTPKKKGKRGRGRPKGTYRTRVLPSGRVVKVPTHIYKKMLAQEKAQIRLIRAQRQAQAEQLAVQQDLRYQPDVEDERFLEEPDQMHEMEVMRARQQAEMAQLEQEQPQIIRKPGIARRIIRNVSRLGTPIRRLGAQPTMFDEFGRPIEPQAFRPQPMGMGLRSEPRVTAISGKANLLTVPNQFNNTGQSTLLENNRRRLY